MDDWLEPGDGRFDLAYVQHNLFQDFSDSHRCQLFTKYVVSGLHITLFDALNPPTSNSEPITPAQTALLKLLDSYLSSDHENRPRDYDIFLLPTLDRLSTYATSSLSSGLDDARLPKVLEALVLVTESLGSIGLACQSRHDKQEAGGGEEEIVTAMKEGAVVACVVGTSLLPTMVQTVNSLI
jgi:ataxin-10